MYLFVLGFMSVFMCTSFNGWLGTLFNPSECFTSLKWLWMSVIVWNIWEKKTERVDCESLKVISYSQCPWGLADIDQSIWELVRDCANNVPAENSPLGITTVDVLTCPPIGPWERVDKDRCESLSGSHTWTPLSCLKTTWTQVKLEREIELQY